jgi:hypothetical protein
VTVLRILIWNLADSKTSVDEVREHITPLGDSGAWIANEPQERFGLISSEDELPDLAALKHLIGKEPEIAEEFDVL